MTKISLVISDVDGTLLTGSSADRKRPIASASTALWGESGATLGAAGEARQVSATFIGKGSSL